MHTFANTNELITAALLQQWIKMPKLAVNGEKKGGSLQKDLETITPTHECWAKRVIIIQKNKALLLSPFLK